MNFAVAFAYIVLCAVQTARAITIPELHQKIQAEYDYLTEQRWIVQNAAYENAIDAVQYLKNSHNDILVEINNGRENCKYLTDDVDTLAFKSEQALFKCQLSIFFQILQYLSPILDVMYYQYDDLSPTCVVTNNMCNIEINRLVRNLKQMHVHIVNLVNSAKIDIDTCFSHNMKEVINQFNQLHDVWRRCVEGLK